MSNANLTLLIPTLPARQDFLTNLLNQIYVQSSHDELNGQFRVIIDNKEGISIGAKRNIMMSQVETDYLCFIDDDDKISHTYLALILAGIATNPDCCSLNGIITTDGKDPKPFKHSIDYDSMYERDGVYYRPPNHLNTVRASIAKQMTFPDWQRSEDSNYCFQLRDSGLLKVEYKIEPVLYYYDYVSDKKY